MLELDSFLRRSQARAYMQIESHKQIEQKGNNPENQNLAVWFCVRPGPTPFFAFGTPARFRVTGAASCGHYAAGAAGKKTVAHHH